MKRLILALLLPAIGGFGQPLHRIPPAGIVVSEKDEHDLRATLERLNQRVENLQGNAHLNDVIIFQKAVRYALDGKEFFTP
jgi:acyl transferase domain-containing protein